MISAISYGLNILLASAYITLRSGYIDNYHKDIDKLKDTIMGLAIDSCQYWGMDRGEPEAQRQNIQLTTELFHFQSQLLSYSRRHKSFDYDKHLSKHMALFRKLSTGEGEISDEERRQKVNDVSVNLSNALDQCYILNKLLYALMFWKKI